MVHYDNDLKIFFMAMTIQTFKAERHDPLTTISTQVLQ